ncbi:MAG TPA: TonB-dependent receptor, partial [Aequorivita sp.]|nr:TonB-dependent receptor [Aequorivita sp.]
MKISIITILALLSPFFFFAQNTVSGIVTDNSGKPIFGANVYLEGTYDGSTSDENGKFSFETSETGTQTLTISYVSFEASKIIDDVSKMKGLKITLRDDVNSLD